MFLGEKKDFNSGAHMDQSHCNNVKYKTRALLSLWKIFDLYYKYIFMFHQCFTSAVIFRQVLKFLSVLKIGYASLNMKTKLQT